jgi:hypothetical protein
MRAAAVLAAALAPALALAGCEGDQPAEQKQQRRPQAQQQQVRQGPEAGVTPMAERVAVIGLLNKRNGIVRNLTMKPGQSVRVKDAIVRLRACETTAPWETEKLTGAFVQLDVQRTDDRWQRAFSGWLYKETPSLNVVEHPVYDVWPRSCAMTFPGGTPAEEPAASNRSSARNSGRSRPAPAPTSPSAADNDAT